MNLEKLNDWLQVFGLLGIIASLIFVGMEMRQTQRITLAATYNERAINPVTVDDAPEATAGS